MCGIVGLVPLKKGHKTWEQINLSKNLFKQLLKESQIRGCAASGIFISSTNTNQHSEIKTIRCPLRAEDLLKSESGLKVLGDYNNRTNFMVGHTRAISGMTTAKNNYNNHPHICGDIIGVHNGKIESKHIWKNIQGWAHPKGTCDSEAIFAYINYLKNDGMSTRTAAKVVASKLEGWFTIVFMDTKEPEKLYIMRDSASPLSCAWWPEARTYVLASSEEILNTAANKVGVRGLISRAVMDNSLYEMSPTVPDDSSRVTFTRFYAPTKDNKEYLRNNKEDYAKTYGG
jgi:glucosamine 6-phosphate synthetase-like amidotransferase/phosphosugar isomerase protein